MSEIKKKYKIKDILSVIIWGIDIKKLKFNILCTCERFKINDSVEFITNFRITDQHPFQIHNTKVFCKFEVQFLEID